MDVLSVIKHSRIAFMLAFAAALVMLLISEGAYWRSMGTLDDLDATWSARASIRELRQGLLEAESGQRGYLLTQRKEFLKPHAEGVERVRATIDAIDRRYGGTPEMAAELAELHRLSALRLGELAQTIGLHDAGQVDATAFLLVGGNGRYEMEVLRLIGVRLLEREQVNVARGRQGLDRTLFVNRGAIAVMSALGLLALFMYLRQNYALNMQKQELARVVQIERERLEVEVLQRTMELTQLTRYLQNAREDERARLARNLHDDLGALLTSAKLDAARIRPRLAGSPPGTPELLAHLVGNLNAGVALGRRIIEDLRPSALGNLGLVATLEILVREFAQDPDVQVHCTLEPVQLSPAAELMAYRLVQEALTNITKYAQATNIWIDMGTRDGQASVSVRDDGVGFDTEAPRRAAYGLLGMRFRVEAEGGVLTLVSAPGQGTLVQVTLPPSAPQAA